MQITKKPSRIYSWQEKLFALLFISIIITSASYVYFMAGSVMSVVQRETINTETLRLRSYVGELEAEYIALGQTITRDTASALGLVEPERLSYAERKSLALQALSR